MKSRISTILRVLAVGGAFIMATQSAYASGSNDSSLAARCRAYVVSHPFDYCGGKDPGYYERCVEYVVNNCVLYPKKYFPDK